MELIKTTINSSITKIDIGAEYSEEIKKISGLVELDIENQAYFVDIINTILDDGITNIIVNMEFISYIDSSGLWALFEGFKKARQKNGKLVLLNPTKDVRRVLDITKMSSKIKIASAEKDAIEYIESSDQDINNSDQEV
jgi:anti-sigma B factor antagonist